MKREKSNKQMGSGWPMNAPSLSRRSVVAAGVLAPVAGLLPPGIASGQQFDGSVRLVVANPAGGPLDIVARSIADFLAAKWKQTVLVDNRPGGNGIIAANYVAKAKPDGQTLLMTATYSESILPYAAEKLPYNAEKDFIPVTEIARVGFVLLVPGASSIRTFQDFVEQARSSSKPLSVGGLGKGSSLHLAWELIKKGANLRNIEYIPYISSGQAQTDLMGGQLNLLVDTFGSARAFIESGRVRAIAITSTNRSAQLPSVPTLDESGLKGFEIFPWIGLVAPAGVAPDRVLSIQVAVAEALANPLVRGRLTQFGFTPVGNTPTEMAKTIKSERSRFAPLVKELGISLQ